VDAGLHTISIVSAGRLHVRLMGCGTDMEGAMDPTDAPALAGVHHLKLPVSDLARSRQWYRSRLGYEVRIEFVEQGKLMGYGLEHPNGGPRLGLRFDPARARAAAGFDYFAIGVPDKVAIDRLAGQLSALGEDHAGVHFASIGWILPQLHDPDGHEIRFYTIEHHTDARASGITTIDDPRESSERREREWHTASTSTDQASGVG
jgi:catechol 2,3-dioxygenase-like lactoylglutathione lyase family enzyme